MRTTMTSVRFAEFHHSNAFAASAVVISRCLMSFVAITLLALFPTVSQATLIGDEVQADGPGFAVSGGSDSAIVGTGIEFTGSLFSIDVGASSVAFAPTYGSGSQNIGGLRTVVLSDLDWVGTPGIVIGTENLVVNGFPTFNVTGFTDDSVTFEFQGNISFDASASFDLVTEHVPPVPEPSSLILAGLALTGLAMFRRRRIGSSPRDGLAGKPVPQE